MKEEGRDVAVCSKRFHAVGFIPCCLLWFDLQIHSAVQQVGFRRFKRGYKSLQAPIDPAAAIAAAAKEHKDPTDPYFAYQWYLVSELTMVFLPYIIGCQETQTVQVQHKSVVGQIQSPSVTYNTCVGVEKMPTKKRFRSVKRGQEGKKQNWRAYDANEVGRCCCSPEPKRREKKMLLGFLFYLLLMPLLPSLLLLLPNTIQQTVPTPFLFFFLLLLIKEDDAIITISWRRTSVVREIFIIQSQVSSLLSANEHHQPNNRTILNNVRATLAADE